MKRLAALFLILSALPAWSAELVMIDADWCSWCKRWEADIGVMYDKTPEAKIAPLRRVSIDGPMPDDLIFDSSPRYTPTFILFKNGQEIDRFEGYPGESAFWGMLQRMLDKLPAPRRKVQIFDIENTFFCYSLVRTTGSRRCEDLKAREAG
ncbi:thioredoxin family protein [Rhodobacteraceae bacterium NNCM2]|nr:thioredoxin family protein [Coraliihabitans acroporae]